jgi:hypothetical protein
MSKPPEDDFANANHSEISASSYSPCERHGKLLDFQSALVKPPEDRIERFISELPYDTPSLFLWNGVARNTFEGTGCSCPLPADFVIDETEGKVKLAVEPKWSNHSTMSPLFILLDEPQT